MATCRRARCKPGSAGSRYAALGSATARGGRRRRAGPLHLGHFAALSPPRALGRGTAALFVLEGDLDGRLRGGVNGGVKRGHSAVWAEDHERWNRRDLSARRYVYFWGRHLLQAAPGARQTMPAGDHRCRRGRPQGYRRGLRRRPRERAGLARGSARPEAPQSALRAGVGRRRRRARLLEGAAQGLRPNDRAALLGTQDRQRPEQ